jgi:hypothetical protein
MSLPLVGTVVLPALLAIVAVAQIIPRVGDAHVTALPANLHLVLDAVLVVVFVKSSLSTLCLGEHVTVVSTTGSLPAADAGNRSIAELELGTTCPRGTIRFHVWEVVVNLPDLPGRDDDTLAGQEDLGVTDVTDVAVLGVAGAVPEVTILDGVIPVVGPELDAADSGLDVRVSFDLEIPGLDGDFAEVIPAGLLVHWYSPLS